MAFDFPNSPTIGQVFGNYTWDGEKWATTGGAVYPPATAPPLMDGTATVGTSLLFARQDHVHPFDTATVRNDAPQSLAASQQQQARQNVGVPASNVVINGDFRVNQTVYVSAAALAAGTYGHDQWKAGASGGDYSFAQLKSSTQITIAAGKSLIQPIEDANVTGGSYVLSWTGTAQARAGVNTLTPSGSYAASPLLITGQIAGTVMSVEFNSGTLGTVKLESGSLVTPFIMRPYDQELATCQRYYKLSSPMIGHWFEFDAAQAIFFAAHHPFMRTAPTMGVRATGVQISRPGVANYDIGASVAAGYPNGIYGSTVVVSTTAAAVNAPASLVSAAISFDARL